MSTFKSVELVCRGSVLWRILDRAPTYLADLREDPRWLIMFLFARTTAGRYYGRHRQAPATGGARDIGPTCSARNRHLLLSRCKRAA